MYKCGMQFHYCILKSMANGKLCILFNCKLSRFWRVRPIESDVFWVAVIVVYKMELSFTSGLWKVRPVKSNVSLRTTLTTAPAPYPYCPTPIPSYRPTPTPTPTPTFTYTPTPIPITAFQMDALRCLKIPSFQFCQCYTTQICCASRTMYWQGILHFFLTWIHQ